MMQRLRSKTVTSDAARLEADRHGNLYDPSLRETLTQAGTRADIEALEALAALRLAASRVHGALERWTESHGLSESQLRVLMALYYSPHHRRPLGELAEFLNVVPRTITDVVDVLERDELTRRRPDPDDRRSVHAQLTAGGLERVESLRRDAVDRQTAIFASFKREQLVQLRHLCLLLVQQLARANGGS